MLKDQYDNSISTSSTSARDHYTDAVDRVLAGQAGIVQAFEQAVDADPDFALGFAGLARGKQYGGDMAGAREAIATAQELSDNTNLREQSHINAFSLMINGKGPLAYSAIRQHVESYPRDALIAQTCSSVFGLIGFSGKPGREAEMLAYNAALMPHYAEDWWCLSQYAFALCETGNLDKASDLIDQALLLNGHNANAAHVRSHVYYEMGETEAGIEFLDNWLKSYDRAGYLHGHLSWHVALWLLEQGDSESMWERIQTDIQPGASIGLPINILTDTAAILYRATLTGVSIPQEIWVSISQYAKKSFPSTGIGFVDFHAAIAHAMAGDEEALAGIIDKPNPLTGDLVTPVAQAYRAFANQHWNEGIDLLSRAMADHARLGGSRAQRDILELSLASALHQLGKNDEAARYLVTRRPVLRP